MQWESFSRLKGCHSLLSPSQCYWVFDEAEDFEDRFCSSFSQKIGTLLHDQAAKYIQYGPSAGFRVTKKSKNDVFINLLAAGIPRGVMDHTDFDGMYDNFSRYVNDAIGFHMSPEVCLYFSENCFGHADAIDYNEKQGILRIHDLKTGISPVKIEQLYVYTALFFLQYKWVKPGDTKIELRIYQTGKEIFVDTPGMQEILPIMDKIRAFDKRINEMKGC